MSTSEATFVPKKSWLRHLMPYRRQPLYIATWLLGWAFWFILSLAFIFTVVFFALVMFMGESVVTLPDGVDPEDLAYAFVLVFAPIWGIWWIIVFAMFAVLFRRVPSPGIIGLWRLRYWAEQPMFEHKYPQTDATDDIEVI